VGPRHAHGHHYIRLTREAVTPDHDSNVNSIGYVT
jgi:hypothetical protein